MAVDQLKDSDDIQTLIDEGKRKGVLTQEEISDTLSHHEDLDADTYEDLLQTFADEGIRVIDKVKDYSIPLADPITHPDAVLAHEAVIPE